MNNFFSIKCCFLDNNRFFFIRKLKILVLFCAVVFSNSCNESIVDPVKYGTIFPLDEGNNWNYKIIEPYWINDTLVSEITGKMDIVFEGKTYTVTKRRFYGKSQPMPEYSWLNWIGPDGLYFMGGVSPTDTFIVKDLELKYPASVGDRWEIHDLAYSLDRREFYIRDTLTYSLSGKNVILETPAGKFDCYVYEFIKWPEDDVADNWKYQYYYAVGVGLVGNQNRSESEEWAIKEEFLLTSYKTGR